MSPGIPDNNQSIPYFWNDIVGTRNDQPLLAQIHFNYFCRLRWQYSNCLKYIHFFFRKKFQNLILN